MILGNHDVAVTRDPFSRAAELDGLAEVAVLLRDEATSSSTREPASSSSARTPTATRRDGRGRGSSRTRRPICGSSSATFPGIARRLPDGAFDLVLAGHLHAGQIALPYPGGRVPLAHPRSRYVAGLYEAGGGVMHVSPGTGTTFVPLRFCARPEVTELVLRPATGGLQQSA